MYVAWFYYITYFKCTNKWEAIKVWSGSLKGDRVDNIWRKFGAFVHNVRIHSKFAIKLPYYKWLWMIYDYPVVLVYHWIL